MALNKFVGSVAVNTGTGNQAITGVGFQPKVVLFWLTGATADGNAADAIFMFGTATSSTDRRVIFTNSDDANATSAVSRHHDNANCVRLQSPTGTDLLVADFVTMDSDGFTINLSVAGTAYILNYMALGGSDLTGYKTGQFTENTATGNQSITGLGFQPEAVMFFESRSTTTAPANGGAGSYTLRMGWATSASDQYAYGNRVANAAAATNSDSYAQLDQCFVSVLDGGIDSEATFVSMDADGFTFNMTNVAGASYYMFYLALAGGQYKVKNFTQKTSTGTDAITGVGFQPEAMLLMSGNKAANAATENDAYFSFGGATSTSQRSAIWAGDKHAADPTQADSNLDRTKVIKMLTAGTPTLDAAADLSSFDSDGFTLDWTTADATARQISALVIAGDPVVSQFVPKVLFI